jgi:hypothetical protein
MAASDNTVIARPSKAFFIEMITRDLGLTDCILDLIDNAIDHAVARAGADVMTVLTNGGGTPHFEGSSIELAFTEDEFTIRDTCGGIPIKDARDKVFLFGNPAEKGTPSGLSVFGIGMKRAFFKIGRLISMNSQTPTDWFSIDIDVTAWQNKGDENWDFEFKETGLRTSGDSRGDPGTAIRITNLRNEVRERLRQPSFRNDLVQRIAATYGLFISAGLILKVQGNEVEADLPAFGAYDKLTPARRMIERDGVDILIMAGVTPADDRIPRGWYVFCNGRMILGADRTRVTGWGDGLPQWQPKYRPFLGYVYFRSEDVRRLPWTTTKQGVVAESPLYQTALSEMSVQARPVITFLNNVYPGEQLPEGVVEREALAQARPVTITQIPRKEAVFTVDLEEEKTKSGNALVNIQYKKPRKAIDRIKECLKQDLSAAKIGEHTFEYFLKQECE